MVCSFVYIQMFLRIDILRGSAYYAAVKFSSTSFLYGERRTTDGEGSVEAEGAALWFH